jgi:retron-type reverse transcriptase
VKCFDRIDHELFLTFLREKLGAHNFGLIHLIATFLQTPIVDKKGKNDTFHGKGILQGSPISPVLMNFFLHHLGGKTDV